MHCKHALALADGRVQCKSPLLTFSDPDNITPTGYCDRCKFPNLDERPPREEVKRLSFARKTANYVRARARWEAAGRPEVPPDVRAARRAICDTCNLRDTKTDECTACGCKLHATLLGDKLAWASEACPKGKWGTWSEPEPVAPLYAPPPVDVDWPTGQEPAFLALALHVEGLAPLRITIPNLSKGVAQVWSGQGSAPVWGRAEPCNEETGEWHSIFDWTASVSRLAKDGPNKRFVLTLERFTQEHCVRILASKLSLLSLTPFLAVGQGVLMCGEQGGATTPCKSLLLAPWSVTVTEGQA